VKGEFLGGTRFIIDRDHAFSRLTSGSGFADTLAHEISHVYQARIMRLGREKMLQLINIEIDANVEAGIRDKYWYPSGFPLPEPNRLPGIVPLECISARFGKTGAQLWRAAIF
jgi:hypothetical protein